MVWILNGLFCKLLNLVPRHQQIVARILGNDYAFITTKIIGALEVVMFIWILSGIKSRWCCMVQIAVIASMNTIEFFLVPDLLLFGHGNAILATLLICLIILNEFFLPISLPKKAL